MSVTSARVLSSMGLALGLSFAMMPLACGGPEGYARPTHAASEGLTAPPATVERLTACAAHGQGRLTDSHYAIVFDVDVTEGGRVREARVKDSLLGDRGIESCMVSALEEMSVSRSVVDAMVSQARSSSGVSPASRGAMGNVFVLGGGITLTPVVIALGVTIIVAISLHVGGEVVEAIKKRPRKVEQKCQPLLDECLDNPEQPEWNRRMFGERKQCEACFFHCLRHNEWPEAKCPRPD